jgi:hypothetical protein
MQKLYPCKNFTHAKSLPMQKLYPCKNFTHAKTLPMQKLYPCKNFTHAKTLPMQNFHCDHRNFDSVNQLLGLRLGLVIRISF